MTFLAHWKIGGSPGSGLDGQPAIDSAAGGLGAHNGVYRVTTEESITSTHGYDEYQSLRGSGSGTDGIIDTIANVSDLQLTGTYTVMFWFMPRNVLDNGMYVYSVGASGESLETNFLVHIEARSNGSIRVFWEYDAGTDVNVYSVTELISVIRWHHVAVVRYPISSNYGVKFYIDGVLADTQNNGGAGYPAAADGSSTAAYIGRTATDSTAVNYYNLDSIRVYDTDESANVASVYATESSYFDSDSLTFVPVDPELVVQSRETHDGFEDIGAGLVVQSRETHDGFEDIGPETVVQSRETYNGFAFSGPTLGRIEDERRDVGFFR